MKEFTKAQQDLEDKREFLLLLIAKLKQKNRQKQFELKNKNDYLNKVANKIVEAEGEELELFAYDLNKMWSKQSMIV